MKLTKSKLQQIIKEELSNAVDEGFLDRFRRKPEPEPEPEPIPDATTLQPPSGGAVSTHDIDKVLRDLGWEEYDRRQGGLQVFEAVHKAWKDVFPHAQVAIKIEPQGNGAAMLTVWDVLRPEKTKTLEIPSIKDMKFSAREDALGPGMLSFFR